MRKEYFNVNKNSVKNANAARMLRKSDNKSISMGLNLNVDPIHIKKEEIEAQMEDCAIDVQGPSIEVEGQDLVIPVDEDQVIKAGKMKVKVNFGGGRMNQTSAKAAYEMMGGFMNLLTDMWEQKQKIKEEQEEPKDGFDPVE